MKLIERYQDISGGNGQNDKESKLTFGQLLKVIEDSWEEENSTTIDEKETMSKDSSVVVIDESEVLKIMDQVREPIVRFTDVEGV